MTRMRTAVVLFTRDLRVHDNPALDAAGARADRIVPLFVFDDGITGSGFAQPNRVAFLLESLDDLDARLRDRGGRLFRRRGDVVRETLRVAHDADAEIVVVADDVSGYAQRREARLRAACERARIELSSWPGVTIVEPGELVPAKRDHYEVFGSYWRRWRSAPRRAVLGAPRRVTVPTSIPAGITPSRRALAGRGGSPDRAAGGEIAGRAVMTKWLRASLARYGDLQDRPYDDATSRLSPYLHFGCISPLELEQRAADRPGSDSLVRQLCWRDFYHQLLAARPETALVDLRDREIVWTHDDGVLDAWKAGRTGYPFVDAGMRQLLREGWMHNRTRLVSASFLTRYLNIDWRAGAAHFIDLLVDGDVANNVGNWQWVAGTGVDTRPNRVFNPVRQGRRLDPDGDYVRRYVPELAHIEGAAVHEPWKLDGRRQRAFAYPARIVEAPIGASRTRPRRSAPPTPVRT